MRQIMPLCSRAINTQPSAASIKQTINTTVDRTSSQSLLSFIASPLPPRLKAACVYPCLEIFRVYFIMLIAAPVHYRARLHVQNADRVRPGRSEVFLYVLRSPYSHSVTYLYAFGMGSIRHGPVMSGLFIAAAYMRSDCAPALRSVPGIK